MIIIILLVSSFILLTIKLCGTSLNMFRTQTIKKLPPQRFCIQFPFFRVCRLKLFVTTLHSVESKSFLYLLVAQHFSRMCSLFQISVVRSHSHVGSLCSGNVFEYYIYVLHSCGSVVYDVPFVFVRCDAGTRY